MPYTILLVDDEKPVRDLTRRMLERGGFVVTPFGRPLEVLSRLDSGAEPRPSAAVIDLLMPGMTGVTLGKELRHRFPGLPIVFISAYAADTHLAWPAEAPQSMFLSKPFTSAQLREALRTVLRHSGS